MRRVIAKLEKLFRAQNATRPAPCRRPRLLLETLEDRSLLSATASGVITGVAYVDGNQNGVRDPGEGGLPGAIITLTGTTNQGAHTTAAVSSDNNGNFSFQNIQPGSYTLSAAAPFYCISAPASFSNLSTTEGINILSGLSVSGGQSTTENVGFGGLAAPFIGGEMFLNNPLGFPFGAGGSGSAVLPRPALAPTMRPPWSSGAFPRSSGSRTPATSSIWPASSPTPTSAARTASAAPSCSSTPVRARFSSR
jgi:hypothetical protein